MSDSLHSLKKKKKETTCFKIYSWGILETWNSVLKHHLGFYIKMARRRDLSDFESGIIIGAHMAEASDTKAASWLCFKQD